MSLILVSGAASYGNHTRVGCQVRTDQSLPPVWRIRGRVSPTRVHARPERQPTDGTP